MPVRNTAHEQLIKAIFRRYGADPRWRIWENHTGMAYRNGRPIRFGLVGSGDILGITRGGIFLALEVKTGQARQTEKQRAFEEMILKYCGIYRLIRTIADVDRLIETI